MNYYVVLLLEMIKESSSIRTLFLTNIFSPYRVTFLNFLAKSPGIELKVYYAASHERNRQWTTPEGSIQHTYEILPGLHLPLRNRTIHINYGIGGAMRKFRPHTLVIGTDILSTPVSWTALYFARMFNCKIIRFEGQHSGTVSPSRLKRFFYKAFYNRTHKFFVYSELTKAYLREFGIEDHNITVGYNVGDTDYFLRSMRKIENTSDFLAERKRYPEVMFLFCGRLTPSKNVLGLLNIFLSLSLKDAGLFIIGGGEQKPQVQKFITEHPNLSACYMDFRQKDDLVKYYLLSDIFVLPTFYDRASIVLSEALFSGLYTIASIYDGSSRNFIIDGLNGTVIDPNNLKQFREALLFAYERKKAGGISKASIQDTMNIYTIGAYVQRLVDLIRRD